MKRETRIKCGKTRNNNVNNMTHTVVVYCPILKSGMKNTYKAYLYLSNMLANLSYVFGLSFFHTKRDHYLHLYTCAPV